MGFYAILLFNPMGNRSLRDLGISSATYKLKVYIVK